MSAPIASPGAWFRGRTADDTRRQSRLRLFVPARTFDRILVTGLLLAALLIPAYANDSLWIGAGVLLTSFVLLHAISASRTVPWIPGVLATIACIQWILAPWAAYHLPHVLPMATTASDYFGFAVPATFALVAGVYLPLRRRGRYQLDRHFGTIAAPPVFRLTCEVMVFGGLFVRIVMPALLPSSLRYAAMLFGALSLVGAFGLMLVRASGWGLRVALALGVQLAYAAADGVFHEALLWVLYFGLMLTYRFRLRARTLLLTAVSAVIALLTLNGFKADYRQMIETEQLSTSDKLQLAARSFYDLLSRPGDVFSVTNRDFNISRVNQGWVISRILVWVPNAEPFAGGETIVQAVRAAVLPRVLDSDKVSAGGRDYTPRFTGMELVKGTSINLSIAGEMYANFGRTGAWLGVFVYGLWIGFVFRFFVQWSRQSPLLWAWVPYVMLWTVTAESGLAETLNQVTKSFVVMLVVTTLVPGWVMLRRWRFGSRRRALPEAARRQAEGPLLADGGD